MIPGSRVGRLLLGKWHLHSFVVSVIGLPAPWADSSPREAPPACQLRSVTRASHGSVLCRHLDSFTSAQNFPVTSSTLLIHLRQCAPNIFLSFLIAGCMGSSDEVRAPSSAVLLWCLQLQQLQQRKAFSASFIPFFFIMLPSCASYTLQTNTSAARLSQHSAPPPFKRTSGCSLGPPPSTKTTISHPKEAEHRHSRSSSEQHLQTNGGPPIPMATNVCVHTSLLQLFVLVDRRRHGRCVSKMHKYTQTQWFGFYQIHRVYGFFFCIFSQLKLTSSSQWQR